MINLKNEGLLKRRGTQNVIENSDKPVTHDEVIKDPEASSKNKIMGLVFASLLLDLLAFTMILPLFPSLLDYYDKEEGKGNGLYAWLLGAVKSFQRLTGTPDRFASVLFGGALGSMYSFLQFLTSPIVGSLSDAYGRKPMLLICLVGIAASHALWGGARAFGVFVAARAVGGLSKANVSLSMAVVTDVSSEKNRARGMALIGLAFSVGFIVGPLAGAWFSKQGGAGAAGAWGERPAGWALALSLANVALVAFCLPETLPKDKRTSLSLSLGRAVDYVSPPQLLRFAAVPLPPRPRAALARLGLVYFLYLFVYSGLEFTLTFLTHHTFRYTAMQQGKMFLVIGAIMAVLQGGAARRLSARGAARAARAALALTPLSFLAVAAAAAPAPPLLAPLAWLWLGLVLFAVSTAFAVSCLTSLAAAQAAAARGAALGVLRSLGALARALGPLLASAAYWYCGAATTYTVGAVVLIVPAVMLYRLKV